jgi:adenylate kinase
MLARRFPPKPRAGETRVHHAEPTGATADAVIYREIPEDVARKRPSGPAQADRADPAAIEQRLEVFHAETAPLLDLYEQRGILVTVDAEVPVAAVTVLILDRLTRRKG